MSPEVEGIRCEEAAAAGEEEADAAETRPQSTVRAVLLLNCMFKHTLTWTKAFLAPGTKPHVL